MDEMTISPEAQQAFKLDYANKCLLLVEAQAEIGRLRAELAALRRRMADAGRPADADATDV